MVSWFWLHPKKPSKHWKHYVFCVTMIVFGEKLVTKKSAFSQKSIDKRDRIVYIIIIKGKTQSQQAERKLK
nr:MAG TPA: hypothetical protein [Caudoviricetes sp.]